MKAAIGRVLMVTFCCALLLGAYGSVNAFKIGFGGIGSTVHESITSTSLAFLKSDVLDAIVAGNRAVDLAVIREKVWIKLNRYLPFPFAVPEQLWALTQDELRAMLDESPTLALITDEIVELIDDIKVFSAGANVPTSILDSPTASAAHFDDCHFQEGRDRINRLYDSVLADLRIGGSPQYTPYYFGQVLHAAQDFYAHSNWVELERTDLAESAFSYWWPQFEQLHENNGLTRPVFHMLNNEVVLLEGTIDDLKAANLALTRNGSKLSVQPAAEPLTFYQGVVTGAYGSENKCPHLSPTLEHGVPFTIDISIQDVSVSVDGWESGNLNKDMDRDEQGDLFEQASHLAALQTKHEFCRLLSLVAADPILGVAAANDLLNRWVKPDPVSQAESIASCPDLGLRFASNDPTITPEPTVIASSTAAPSPDMIRVAVSDNRFVVFNSLVESAGGSTDYALASDVSRDPSLIDSVTLVGAPTFAGAELYCTTLDTPVTTYALTAQNASVRAPIIVASGFAPDLLSALYLPTFSDQLASVVTESRFIFLKRSTTDPWEIYPEDIPLAGWEALCETDLAPTTSLPETFTVYTATNAITIRAPQGWSGLSFIGDPTLRICAAPNCASLDPIQVAIVAGIDPIRQSYPGNYSGLSVASVEERGEFVSALLSGLPSNAVAEPIRTEDINGRQVVYAVVRGLQPGVLIAVAAIDPGDGTPVVLQGIITERTAEQYLPIYLDIVAAAGIEGLIERDPGDTLATPTRAPLALNFLSYGDTRDGLLTTTGPSFYYFSGQAGDEAIITLNSSDFDPYLELYDDTDTLIAENDDFDDLNSRIELTLERTGTYKILAKSFSPDESGTFVLNLNRVVGEAVGMPPDVLAAIQSRLDPPGQPLDIVSVVKLTENSEIPLLQAAFIITVTEDLVILGESSDSYCVVVRRPRYLKLRDYDYSIAAYFLGRSLGAPGTTTQATETHFIVQREINPQLINTLGNPWRVIPAKMMEGLSQDWNDICGYQAGQDEFYQATETPTPRYTHTPTPTATQTPSPTPTIPPLVYGEHPVGRTVAIIAGGYSLSDRDDEIFLLDVDTGAMLRLTDNLENEWLLRWSHDGRKLAYFGDRYNSNLTVYLGGLRILDLETMEIVNVEAPPPARGLGQNLAWSPDDSKLVFTVNGSTGPEVYVVNADGSSVQNLSKNDGTAFRVTDDYPYWSSDGTQVYFRSDRAEFAGPHYVVLPDGTGLRPHQRLIDNLGGATMRWSPSSHSGAGFDEQGNLVIYDEFGANARVYDTDGRFNSFGEWSSDERRLATINRRTDELVILDLQSGDVQTFDWSDVTGADRMAWLSDDTSIVYWSEFGVSTIDLGSGDSRPVPMGELLLTFDEVAPQPNPSNRVMVDQRRQNPSSTPTNTPTLTRTPSPTHTPSATPIPSDEHAIPIFVAQTCPIVSDDSANGQPIILINPDGSQTATTVAGAIISQNHELLTVYEDRSPVNLTGISSPEYRQDFDPMISPDGNSVAFMSGGRLSVMGLDGSNRRSFDFGANQFEWLPDSQALVFARVDDDYVGVINVVTGEITAERSGIRLPEDGDFLSVAADGSIVIVVGGNLVLLDPDLSQQTQLTELANAVASTAAFSSDGQTIAFVAMMLDSDVFAEVFLIQRDGSNQRNLTNGAVNLGTIYADLRWSSDDRWLLIDDPSADLLVEVSTGSVSGVRDNTGMGFGSAYWLADGSGMLATRYRTSIQSESGFFRQNVIDVYVIEAVGGNSQLLLKGICGGISVNSQYQGLPSVSEVRDVSLQVDTTVALPTGTVLSPTMTSTPVLSPSTSLELTATLTPSLTPTPSLTATPTSTLPPTQTSQLSATPVTCPGTLPSRLVVGQQARVVLGQRSNRIRSQPTTSSREVGRIPDGGTFSVLEGPTCAGGYAWWRVNYQGLQGWTAEADFETYWLELIQQTPPIQSTQSSSNVLVVGGQARVFTEDEGLKLRTSTSTSAAVIENLPPGTIVTLLEGPLSADGYVWWRVRTPSGREGWSVESAEGVITLIPQSASNSTTPGNCLANVQGGANLRTGPGTGFDVGGSAQAGIQLTVVSKSLKSNGRTWYEFDNGLWAREDLLTLSGDCSGLPDD